MATLKRWHPASAREVIPNPLTPHKASKIPAKWPVNIVEKATGRQWQFWSEDNYRPGMQAVYASDGETQKFIEADWRPNGAYRVVGWDQEALIHVPGQRVGALVIQPKKHGAYPVAHAGSGVVVSRFDEKAAAKAFAAELNATMPDVFAELTPDNLSDWKQGRVEDLAAIAALIERYRHPDAA